jgi:hypothetical protein
MSGALHMQMDVHLTVTVESPWLWAFQSRIEKVFVSKVEQDIKIYLAFMAAVISQRAELHKVRVSCDWLLDQLNRGQLEVFLWLLLQQACSMLTGKLVMQAPVSSDRADGSKVAAST